MLSIQEDQVLLTFGGQCDFHEILILIFDVSYVFQKLELDLVRILQKLILRLKIWTYSGSFVSVCIELII